MDDQNVYDAADKVRDAASFIVFLDALRANWEEAVLAEKKRPSNPYSSMHGWENTDIGSFLEAAIAGATDNDMGRDNAAVDAAMAWRQAAAILLLGKIYE